jgi:hypothetical protein
MFDRSYTVERAMDVRSPHKVLKVAGAIAVLVAVFGPCSVEHVLAIVFISLRFKAIQHRSYISPSW